MTAEISLQVYHSVTPTVVLAPTWPFERKDRISHFTEDGLIFNDGSELSEYVKGRSTCFRQANQMLPNSVDVVYLGTGFIIRYEYLERGGILQRRPGQSLPEPEDETWPGIVSTDLYRELICLFRRAALGS